MPKPQSDNDYASGNHPIKLKAEITADEFFDALYGDGCIVIPQTAHMAHVIEALREKNDGD